MSENCCFSGCDTQISEVKMRLSERARTHLQIDDVDDDWRLLTIVSASR